MTLGSIDEEMTRCICPFTLLALNAIFQYSLMNYSGEFTGAGDRKWKSAVNLTGKALGGNEGNADAMNKNKRHLSGGIPPLCKHTGWSYPFITI
ncbi:hypothetical protein AAHA92_13378 [Salvia divinorum]|uniref:Uncharacterized protein n=1 Tax=Salvia divinorum TaxID=28513 RepID=A0ABD1H827_SALDI